MTERTIPDVIGVEPDTIEDNTADQTTFSRDLDLALMVGSEKTRPEKERILVSSVVLRLASPVFAAMPPLHGRKVRSCPPRTVPSRRLSSQKMMLQP